MCRRTAELRLSTRGQRCPSEMGLLQSMTRGEWAGSELGVELLIHSELTQMVCFPVAMASVLMQHFESVQTMACKLFV